LKTKKSGSGVGVNAGDASLSFAGDEDEPVNKGFNPPLLLLFVPSSTSAPAVAAPKSFLSPSTSTDGVLGADTALSTEYEVMRESDSSAWKAILNPKFSVSSWPTS
jgi:hypothetical protein